MGDRVFVTCFCYTCQCKCWLLLVFLRKSYDNDYDNNNNDNRFISRSLINFLSLYSALRKLRFLSLSVLGFVPVSELHSLCYYL